MRAVTRAVLLSEDSTVLMLMRKFVRSLVLFVLQIEHAHASQRDRCYFIQIACHLSTRYIADNKILALASIQTQLKSTQKKRKQEPAARKTGDFVVLAKLIAVKKASGD